MDKLNTIVEKTLQIAEKSMKDVGHSNPKVVVFYRDMNNELGTYMIDLSPQKYFDGRLEIMNQVGTTFKKFKQESKGIRAIDIAVAYGEAHLTVNGSMHNVLMASALDDKNQSCTRFREIRNYMMPDHPEKQFFELQDFEIKGLKYTSPTLKELFTNFNK